MSDDSTFTIESQHKNSKGTGYVPICNEEDLIKTRSPSVNSLAEKLLNHSERKTTHMAPSTMELDPSAVYANQERHKAEIELFKRVPLVMGFSAELREPGSFKTTEMTGLPLLITRDKNGVIHTFLNACTHRGAPLTNKPCGKAARFTCPYHAWTFGNDGRLISVNSQDQFGEFDKSTRNLVELPCTEKAGLIFAILTPGLELDVDTFYEGMLSEIARYGYEDWHYVGSMEAKASNWKLAVEGFLETYHVPSLHMTTLDKISRGGRPPAQAFESFGPHQRFLTATAAPIEEMIRKTISPESRVISALSISCSPMSPCRAASI